MQVDLIPLLVSILISSVLIFVLVKILPEISFKDFKSSIFFVIIFALLNAAIEYALKFFGLNSASSFLEQGSFQIIFNALVILIVSKILGGFYVRNFWYALLASFIFTFVISLLHKYLPAGISTLY